MRLSHRQAEKGPKKKNKKKPKPYLNFRNLGHLAPHENLHDSNPCADDEASGLRARILNPSSPPWVIILE